MTNLEWIMPIVMLLFGIAIKRFPLLKSLPNQIIPWLNLLLGILAKLISPSEAHAGGFLSGAAHVLGWLWPPVQVAIARLIYETFVRPSEELAGVGPLHAEGKVKK